VSFENPFLVFLVFQELNLALLRGLDTYSLSSGEAGASYHPDTNHVADGAYRLSEYENRSILLHEITHSRFAALYEKAKDKLEGAIEYFKTQHSKFFQNIVKRKLYSHLEGNDLGILNELIAYLMASLQHEDNIMNHFGESEDISVKDIEVIAGLGFVPDWARPSQLGYEKDVIDSEYYQMLFDYSIANHGNLSLFGLPHPD